MQTRKRHQVCLSTSEAVNAAKARYHSWAELAESLGYPASFGATLSDVKRGKPGCISAIGEKALRRTLGLDRPRKRQRYARPCLSIETYQRLNAARKAAGSDVGAIRRAVGGFVDPVTLVITTEVGVACLCHLRLYHANPL